MAQTSASARTSSNSAWSFECKACASICASVPALGALPRAEPSPAEKGWGEGGRWEWLERDAVSSRNQKNWKG